MFTDKNIHKCSFMKLVMSNQLDAALDRVQCL